MLNPWRYRIIVVVLMMAIMDVFMGMLHGFMGMLMLMFFRQVQPNSNGH